jgi:hypothetical protein
LFEIGIDGEINIQTRSVPHYFNLTGKRALLKIAQIGFCQTESRRNCARICDRPPEPGAPAGF